MDNRLLEYQRLTKESPYGIELICENCGRFLVDECTNKDCNRVILRSLFNLENLIEQIQKKETGNGLG